MKIDTIFPALPKHSGDYQFAWIVSFLIAIAFAPFIVFFRQSAPWLISVPIALGAVVIVAYEWIASLHVESSESDTLVSLPSDFTGLKSYEHLLALEIRHTKKTPKGQLPLFPGFVETTPSNAIKTLQDEHGKQID